LFQATPHALNRRSQPKRLTDLLRTELRAEDCTNDGAELIGVQVSERNAEMVGEMVGVQVFPQVFPPALTRATGISASQPHRFSPAYPLHDFRQSA
jgi:hypothetical protein